jgi:hypothetical protein
MILQNDGILPHNIPEDGELNLVSNLPTFSIVFHYFYSNYGYDKLA